MKSVELGQTRILVLGVIAMMAAVLSLPPIISATEVPLCNHKACVVDGGGQGEGNCKFVIVDGHDTDCTDPVLAECTWRYCP